MLSRPAISAALDRGTGTYGLAVWGIDSRLASGYGGRKCSDCRIVVWQWRARTWEARKEIPVSKMLSAMHYALGGYLEEGAPRHAEDAGSANHSYAFAMVLSQLAKQNEE